jgi:hypothetical protein
MTVYAKCHPRESGDLGGIESAQGRWDSRFRGNDALVVLDCIVSPARAQRAPIPMKIRMAFTQGVILSAAKDLPCLWR